MASVPPAAPPVAQYWPDGTPPALPPGRARRRWWQAGLVAAVLLLVAGVLVAVVAYTRSSGPDGAVRGYFAALARGDAADALAYGDVPAGPRTLLTADALAAQRRIAPLEGAHITRVRREGDRADVDVSYTLAFPQGAKHVSSTVRVTRRDGDWRLARVAVSTRLHLDRAAQRATLLGAPLPTQAMPVFPGATPVDFDTALLALRPGDDVVGFDTGASVDVQVQVSDAGRRTVAAALRRLLTTCLTGRSDLRCPQPNGRAVPGTLRGTVGSLDDVTYAVGSGAAGTVELGGKVRVRGSYRKLGFDNGSSTGSGELTVPVRARTYAVAPLHLVWVAP